MLNVAYSEQIVCDHKHNVVNLCIQTGSQHIIIIAYDIVYMTSTCSVIIYALIINRSGDDPTNHTT